MRSRSFPTILGLAFLTLCIVVLTSVLLLYTLPRQNQVTMFVGTVFHLPMAKVYGYPVSLYQFVKDLATLESLEAGDSAISRDVLRASVWAYIREEYATQKLAKEQAITWSSEELIAYRDAFLLENELNLTDLYASIPNFNLSYFTEHTVLPMFLQGKIAKKLLLAPEGAGVEEINTLRTQVLANPSQFQEIAKKRAEDQHVTFDDELLLISVKEIAGDEAELLRSLPEGGISPVIVRGDGYRIYQMISHFTDPEEAWQVRELFVPADPLTAALNKIIDSPDEKVYMRGVVTTKS